MKPRLLLSIALGAAFGLLCTFVLLLIYPKQAWMGAAAGFVFMLLLFFFLNAASARSAKKYVALEKTFSKPFEYCADADMWIGEKPSGGKLYLFDDEILFVSFENRKRTDTNIPYSDLTCVTALQKWKLELVTGDSIYTATVSDAEQLRALIESHLRGAWRLAATGPDGNTELYGENIFAYQWSDTGTKIEVTDPTYGQKHVFSVFRVSINGRDHEFAAGELSNCVWGFFIKDALSDHHHRGII